MTEEKKDSKKKKLKYEMPKLVKLNADRGEGVCGTGVRGFNPGPTDCLIGSGDENCGQGNAAVIECETGSGEI